MVASAVAEVVADAHFVVAAVADINLRRTSQLNKTSARVAIIKTGVCYTSATTSAAAVADVVADVYQTPIFAVAAVADINLRRISQLNKNVCYGCYTKNGRLLHVCYNVCYSCYKRVHKCCEQLQHISLAAYRLPNWTSD